VVPKMAQTPGGTRWLGPGLGEHTGEVLANSVTMRRESLT